MRKRTGFHCVSFRFPKFSRLFPSGFRLGFLIGQGVSIFPALCLETWKQSKMSGGQDAGAAFFQPACGFTTLHPFADGAFSFPHEFSEVRYGFHAVGAMAQHGVVLALLGGLTMDIGPALDFVGGEVPKEVRQILPGVSAGLRKVADKPRSRLAFVRGTKLVRVGVEAERLGFDSIWLYDHFHTVPMPEVETTFECWMCTAALARDVACVAATLTVRSAQLVQSPPAARSTSSAAWRTCQSRSSSRKGSARSALPHCWYAQPVTRVSLCTDPGSNSMKISRAFR